MDENSPDFIDSNMNWFYVASNFKPDLPTVTGAVAAIALIIFMGYVYCFGRADICYIRNSGIITVCRHNSEKYVVFLVSVHAAAADCDDSDTAYDRSTASDTCAGFG